MQVFSRADAPAAFGEVIPEALAASVRSDT
jgi:hypothetical protein